MISYETIKIFDQLIPKIRNEFSITHPTNFKSVVILSNPKSPYLLL